MKDSLITILRDKKTDRILFRKTAQKISHILAVETMENIVEKGKKIQTPFEKFEGKIVSREIILVPILRSGIIFLDVFTKYFEDAKIGVLGLKRNEKTAVAKKYYENLPKIGKEDQVIILDPMIATGGSAMLALKILKNKGIEEKNILFVSLIAAPEGLVKIKKSFPGIKIITAVVDRELNKTKFILPGIGDFGDRYFGTI